MFQMCMCFFRFNMIENYKSLTASVLTFVVGQALNVTH